MRLARPHEAPLQNIFCSRAGPLRGRDGKGGSAGASVRARSRRPALHPPPPHPPPLQGSKLLLGTTTHRGVAPHSEEGAHLRDLFQSAVHTFFFFVCFFSLAEAARQCLLLAYRRARRGSRAAGGPRAPRLPTHRRRGCGCVVVDGESVGGSGVCLVVSRGEERGARCGTGRKSGRGSDPRFPIRKVEGVYPDRTVGKVL